MDVKSIVWRVLNVKLFAVHVFDDVLPDPRGCFHPREVGRGMLHHTETLQRECQFASTTLCLDFRCERLGRGAYHHAKTVKREWFLSA